MRGGGGHGEQRVKDSYEEAAAFAEGTPLCDVLTSIMKLVIHRQNSLFLLLILQ